MIGQFCFMAHPPGDAIAVHMVRKGGEAEGSVSMPSDVRLLAIQHDVPVLEASEKVSLAIAMGYAVTIAMMSDLELVLTGDETAWRDDWGQLRKAN